MPRRSFDEKLHDSKTFPEIVEVSDPKTLMRYGGSRMLIAPPLAYDRIMREIPAGQLVTADRVRQHLAAQHGADFTCPLTAGLFINIVANASDERGTDETPYWRTLKKDGELNEKYPGGVEAQQQRLEAEGHQVVQRGKRYFVQDYQQKLLTLR